nr:MAG TPA: hypothetical protein [Caudoviricetes sp.]
MRPPPDDRPPQQAEKADGAEVGGQACPFLVGERGKHGGRGLKDIKDNEGGQPYKHGQADGQKHGSPADSFSFLIRGEGQAIAVQGMLLFLLVPAGLFELVFSHGADSGMVISRPCGGGSECGVEETHFSAHHKGLLRVAKSLLRNNGKQFCRTILFPSGLFLSRINRSWLSFVICYLLVLFPRKHEHIYNQLVKLCNKKICRTVIFHLA